MTNKGFSLLEILFVTAILVAVMAMAFPNITDFFDLRDDKQEELIMAEISAAMARYAEDNKRLPAASEAWYDAFAAYSELSSDEIRYTAWHEAGVPTERQYFQASDAKRYQNSEFFDVYYGVVYSYGKDHCQDFNRYTPLDPECKLLPTVMGSESEYSGFDAEEGDFIAKHSDYKDKIAAHERTVLRLNRIAEALTSYATGYYNEALSAPTPPNNVHSLIYYPPSGDNLPNTNNRYYSLAIWDVENTGGENIAPFDMLLDNDDRRTEMQGLMRVLGLPEEYCCNALETFEDSSGNDQEMPFYYCSNPAAANLTDEKLPPIVRVSGGC